MTSSRPTDGPTAVVVGAGAFGCAAADALARRDWAVTVVERYAPANARGSSGDRTRQLRHGHGSGDAEADLLYVRSAARGIELWRELSDQRGASLIQTTGLVWLAREADGVELRVRDRLAAAGIGYELLTPPEAAALFPDLAIDDLAFALHEPAAGVIRAQEAVLALLARAREHGATVIRGTARPHGAGRIALTDGRGLSADAVIWACGAWLGRLFATDAPVRATWQDIVHWHAPPGWEHTPTWFDEDAMMYGFPDIDGLGIKAVTHRPGREFDPDLDQRLSDRETVRRLSRYVGRRFPALARSAALWTRVMAYEMTPDHNFVVGRASAPERHWLLGGGSGHGFKHAPALGELLAELIETGADPPALFAPGPRAPRRAPGP